MISRVWHGWTSRENADPYQKLLLETVLPAIAARGIPGFHGSRFERRDTSSGAEFVTTLLFDTLDAVVAFAGHDYEAAIVPEAARQLLTRFDARTAHYGVVHVASGVRAELRDLFDYHRWANQKLLDACIVLTDEQFDRTIGGSFPSLRATWTHMLQADRGWVARWHGNPRGEAPDYPGGVSWGELDAEWRVAESAQKVFVNALTDPELDRPIAIITRKGIACELPLGHTLRHVANHGTYHRGQLVNFLRQLGSSAPTTDLMYFYMERDTAAQA